MSRVTLKFDLSKIPLYVSSQGQDLYSHQILNMYIYWFSFDLRAVTDADNARRHSTTTRATYANERGMFDVSRH